MGKDAMFRSFIRIVALPHDDESDAAAHTGRSRDIQEDACCPTPTD